MLVGQTHARMNFAGSQAQGRQGFLPWGMARDDGDEKPLYRALQRANAHPPRDVPRFLGVVIRTGPHDADARSLRCRERVVYEPTMANLQLACDHSAIRHLKPALPYPG